ncbi:MULTISPECIES: enoyl-ACP reductase FabV [Sphingobacterium]|uniref:Enoyl-[acyl-carrier-protein] reductase [NADH] n=1 Tax=Sphingobacterium kitahiroshimense TaxID=470446 RepID=A0ABV0BPW9_9SPHI|nr:MULTISPECIES: enoyl-ACP reductase FabV [Sphingobacterium]MBB2951902.1 enoyl-[acyl-carrier protein] reductase/trans-2-enoyl-CoA reductase (NAD+) [Sphingobacterium sp. JUb56]MCW2260433.1 enoyl-[acyl-carrier protein] reductase/trans-2-enoyl-CoA reductase (NAD+) [Sphingobacterium kitahiroshimense]QQD13677.1 trans-2-enoyl-CoA reductase family protein [Sphingobacterium sp. UDSM-2020]TCR05505.1 enoyl-[acyl-carrier protein] reductase/trans-2-enoyl-CoA reductase (NAD+) [Sphingobacterium sp. JUb78]
MIIQPRTRGFICLTSHPEGTAKNIKNQIEYVKSKGEIANGPKKVLVIGASTGFGIASRISAAFGSGAATIGVFFEKPAAEGKPGTAGWYNTAAFEKEAHEAGLYAKSINGDAFSDEIKKQTIALIKQDLGQVDLIIYSLASPRRTHPKTGVSYASVLKPIDVPFTNKTVDFHTGVISDITINPIDNEEDIANTVAVMGGEDWKFWIEDLKEAGVLADGVKTVAYSYIGPELTFPIYRNGTIGRAKDDLEGTVPALNDLLKDINGVSYVSVNKALVTQSSSAIPVVPLYISLLYKVMKEKGIHEGTIEQMQRLFAERLYTADGKVQLDEKGRIRVDDLEMRADVQAEVAALWEKACTENLSEISDIQGYRDEFFNLFGFNFDGIDYNADTNELVNVPSI